MAKISTAAVLSIITGGGKWVEIKLSADSLYQHLLLTAAKKFWRRVENGEPPRLFGAGPPRARIDAVRIVDMSASFASSGMNPFSSVNLIDLKPDGTFQIDQRPGAPFWSIPASTCGESRLCARLVPLLHGYGA